MTMRKGWAGCFAGAVLVASMAASAAGDEYVRAERNAYLTAAGHAVAVIPDTAIISTVDPLGDHRIALYTVDGPHKNVWLVTTDAACAQPVLLGDRIVSRVSDAIIDCRAVAIQPVDKRTLAAQLRSLQPRGGEVPVDALIDPATLRFATLFHADAMTSGGRTR